MSHLWMASFLRCRLFEINDGVVQLGKKEVLQCESFWLGNKTRTLDNLIKRRRLFATMIADTDWKLRAVDKGLGLAVSVFSKNR